MLFENQCKWHFLLFCLHPFGVLADSVYITGFDLAQQHIHLKWEVEPMGCDIVYTLQTPDRFAQCVLTWF